MKKQEEKEFVIDESKYMNAAMKRKFDEIFKRHENEKKKKK